LQEIRCRYPRFLQISKGFDKIGVEYYLIAFEATGSKFMIKSISKRLLPGVLALIFLPAIIQPEVALSQESQAGRQEVLRQASLKWMQVGTQQYQSKQFADAEQSFRRALVFQKYLTDAERNQLNEFLANTRKATSEGMQARQVTQTPEDSNEPNQPPKDAAGEENIKADQFSVKAEQKQIKKMLDKINSQPGRQNVQPVLMAEPSVSNIQLAAESSNDVIVTKNNSFSSKYMQLSDWLKENRRNILIIGLPILAVLIIILKLQGRKRRPGRRVYENPDLVSSSSFIGARLSEGNKPKKRNKFSRIHRPAPTPSPGPKQGSFTQSTEHWKKNAVQSQAPVKSFETNETWPQRKDKFDDGDNPGHKTEKKQCSKCKKLKPLSEFYKNKSTNDGLARWCKECKSEYRKNQTVVKK
jgi:hypothetical protein